MKKNISVNIFGTIYPIDEDAYELLQKYNANMRSYYGRREGGEEIADDVEHRVAELLSELRAQGVMAITIEHVTEIINRIGDPQQMDEAENDTYTNEESSAPNDTQSHFSSQDNTTGAYTGSTPPPPPAGEPFIDKKLFRDPEDRILGGVLSGLSHYFGIKEPLLLRVITILLGLLSLSTIAILYIIAWILIPEAITPEDRLRMYGKPVNAKSLNEELLRGVHSASNFVNNPQNQDKARGCLSALLKFIIICFAIFICFILCCILFVFFTAITGLGIASIATPSGITEFDTLHNILATIPSWLIVTCVTSVLLLIGLPLYAIIRGVFANKKKSLPPAVKTTLILLWLASIAVLIGSGISIAQMWHHKYEIMQKNENTRDGIYIESDGWSLLDQQGWDVVELQGINPWITSWGINHHGDDGSYIQFEAQDNPNKMKYDLRQSRELKPGKYVIEGYINADGEGNALYAIIPGNNTEVTVDIPAHTDNRNIVETDTLSLASDSGVVIDSSDNGLRKWTHVEKEFDMPLEGKLVYGITNNPAYTLSPWSCQKIAISGVNLRKIE